jgi:hypothetical protein
MDEKPTPISPADLLIDLRNPRIPRDVSSQREALRALAEQQKLKLLALAAHIVAYGRLHPAELPLVMRSENGFIVLEGNRRLTALRALETPEIFVGVLAPKILEDIRSLSAKYRRSPIKDVYCILMSNREEADPWIDLRHNGESGGAGVVDWGPDEKARNSARRGRPVRLHTRLLDFMQEGGHLSQTDRERVKTTNLERVLKSQVLKEALGIEVQNGGHFRIPGDEANTIRLLRLLFKRLTEVSVGKFYSRDERDDWVEEFIAGAPTAATTTTVSQPKTMAAATTQAAPQRARLDKPRTRLIPSTCLLRVQDGRVRRIENELRELLLEDFPNSISVLFRVFVELSADWYIAKHPSAAPPVKPNRDPNLTQKIESVTAHLIAAKKLSTQDAKPVRRACQRDSFLASSIILMNLYVHTFQMSLSPTDLRAQWDNLQPFIVAIWPR